MNLRNFITEEEERVLIFIILIGFIGIISISFREKVFSHKKNINLKVVKNENIKYDLNKVTFEELANIPEIGPSLALNIVTKRDSFLFQNLTDLACIKGVGKDKFRKIEKYFYRLKKTEKRKLSKSVKLININTAGIENLIRIKGISKKKAEKIIVLREKKGGFKSLKEIEKISGIGPKTIERLKSYFYAGEINGRKN